ncbi:MAG: trypsin-like peptidase domain-containing protein [Bacteroidetes bacterium]|nr:trypsin-like peptidase domain-containing protein [Bacteroidota bacterium]
MKEVIERLNDAVIQVATPTGSGTGFYLKNYDIIVTNYHVIHGYSDAVISGPKFKKTLSAVVFFDPVYDLAFIKLPEGLDMPDMTLGESKTARPGDPIIAIGHPFGLNFTATQGIISKIDNSFNSVNYLQIDAAINPGNSGGPLLNSAGEIIGVNTFIFSNGNSLSFALPSDILKETLEEYKSFKGRNATRCTSCQIIISQENIEDGYCINCGAKANEVLLSPQPYTPIGIAKTIEQIINAVGKDAGLSRISPDNWQIEMDDVVINLNYNPETKFIVADAHLAVLPKTNIGQLYEFLLQENCKLASIGFSLFNQNIILSLQMPEVYLNIESGARQLNYLLEKVSFYKIAIPETHNV